MWTIAGGLALLPEGFGLPPTPYLIGLVGGLGCVLALLWALEPPITDRTLLALAPWMMTGGILHALYQVGTFSEVIEPLFAAPAVYATTGIVAGFVWVLTTVYAAMMDDVPDRAFGVIGMAVAITFATLGVFEAFEVNALEPFWPTLALFLASVVTALTWVVLGLTVTDVVATSAWTGAVVVFSHALDGISTAVGYDVLSAGERTPLAHWVLRAGELLPTAEYVGAGWLFVLVKLVLVSTILVLFKEWLDAEPTQARLVLTFVAAVGLGPGTHNVMLFAIGGV